MKDYGLEHLPRRRRGQVQGIVRALHEEPAVEMSILFGGHAGGDWVEDPEAGYLSDFSSRRAAAQPL